MQLSAARPPPPSTKEAIGYFRSVLKSAEGRAYAAGIARVSTELLEGPAVDQILGLIGRESANLLVVGARGLSSTGRFILRSVSTGLMDHATCPVLIHRAAAPSTAPES
ncbi:MAG TPA: universal stress protein [Thermoplasmata archaeon]|nr:universal stress protein [Thermoplasmata archaeon]